MVSDCFRHHVNRDRCVGCTSPDETLVFNVQANQHICDSPEYRRRECDFEKALERIIDAAGDANNLLGAMCPETRLRALGEPLFTSLRSLQRFLRENPDASLYDIQREFIGDWTSAMSSFLLGAFGRLPGPAKLRAAWDFACKANTEIGRGIFLAEEALAERKNPACPPGTSKRSVRQGVPPPTAPVNANSQPALLARNVTSSNPCADFRDIHPTAGFQVLGNLRSACMAIRPFNRAATRDEAVNRAYVTLENLCRPWYTFSSESTGLLRFTNFLSANSRLSPFCDRFPQEAFNIPDS